MNIQPSFTGVTYYPSKSDVQMHLAHNYYINKCIAMDKMLQNFEQSKLPSVISLIKSDGKERLQLQVGKQIFKENFWQGAYSVLKKGLKSLTGKEK